MCAATKGGLSLAGVDVTKEAVVQGRVLRGGNPVAGIRAAARLERRVHRGVPTSATGRFRFFAADGNWTLRTLAPGTKTVDRAVVAARGSVKEIDVDIEAV